MDICKFARLNGCSILNRANCKNCSFFKTEKEFKEGRKKAREMLEALPPNYYDYLNGKYYNRGFQYNKSRGIV